VKELKGKLAVVTGAGSGIGRQLSRQLSAEGCRLALCDIMTDDLHETAALCRESGAADARVTTTACDVSDEAQVLGFRDAVMREHETKHVNLLFNNAGVGGGMSFLSDPREQWDRTFAVCWWGVYYCTRAFMPLLVASDEGHLVNLSSVNGFWASFGPSRPHTAYSSAKFAVKGFTEALMVDTRVHAPHVKVSLVMPGHVGTRIISNSYQLVQGRSIEELSDEQVEPFRAARKSLGFTADSLSSAEIRAAIRQLADGFERLAPTSAAQAAKIILDGVRQERWRILVGADAEALDQAVRGAPEQAYEPEFFARLTQTGHFRRA